MIAAVVEQAPAVTDKTRLLVAATLAPIAVGDLFVKVPPHITLCPPFEIARSATTEFVERLTDSLSEYPALRAKAGELRRYGPENSVEVRKMYVSIFDIGWHIAAVVLAERMGLTPPDKSFIIYDWSPHVSDHDGIEEEQEITFGQVGVFEYKSAYKEVIGVYQDEAATR